ncbi:MAG: LysM peptidoglycan-binding domain-containing protein [Bacteroidales bacterium]|nr:LysM peptidoglycan-binding domain-containing protein [Bacteroidales bacterium]
MKKNVSLILLIHLLLFISAPIVLAVRNAQVPDSLLTRDDFYLGVENPEDDSLKDRGRVLINDAKQADEILNESFAAGMLDSLTNIPFFQDYFFTTDTSLLNIYNFPIGYVPTYPDSIYSERIEKLNRETTMDLTFNQTVKNFIDLYAVRKRQLTSKMLGLKEIYFPLFEEYLDKYDIPLEMKYLAVVESALNPTAGSRAGAKGLWQFMYYTGKLYGLKVTSLTDDRFDPYLSTDAACRHMKDLYNMFGDWNLVMAAYNSGAGNVNKAIRRAGGVRDYWAIWPFLPRETRGYVPAFIAVTYVMNYATEHNLYPLHPGILYDGIDTVMVTQPLAFDQVSEYLNIPKEEVAFLNPMYKSGIIPAYDGKRFNLRLPKEYILTFVENEQAIYEFKSKSGLQKEKLMTEIKAATERQYHIVRSGENLGLIARRYNVSVRQLQQWNNMKGTTIHPGKRLVVFSASGYTPSSSASASSSSGSAAASSSSASPTSTHTVRSGENLAGIARRYGCTIDDIKRWNNLKSNTIYVNQKLKVSDQATAAASAGTSGSDGQFTYYTVKRGDTLWDIAQQYKGVSVEDIRRWNKLGNSSKLQVGQKLKIAAKG